MSKTTDQTLFQKNMPSPSEFMRARHPDLFSDTQVDDVPRIPKQVFEYHLETLTSRKGEYEFEHFCRKLAEKEICPNLRVQTGPTGGGDSKVDTETYPVAEEIAERWWIGSPSAGAEQWAFAFSAKKVWKTKLKADVDSILSTGRDYKRIYFFTNQFVSDKVRATQEDALSKLAKIPVHIIDRAWIVEKVYEANHLELALASLGIEGVQSEKRSRLGPRDAERLLELEELDRQVADPSCYQGARYQLVEDCLRTALLARGLERARNEVESRFVHAERLARSVDYRPQQLRIAYNRAWTAYWWYEDYSMFNQFYEEVEQHVEGSVQACEVQFLLRLWQLLTTSVFAGRLDPQDAKIDSRRQRLGEMLEAIASDPLRLNNALQARTGLVYMRITQSAQAQLSDQLDSCWADLAQIVHEAAPLGTYPIEQLFDIVTELGERISSPAFDSLYEKLVGVIQQRRSDGAAGQARRGFQKLRQEKYYEAIRWFGQAEELLIKDEYRTKLIAVLIGSSCAYENVGLLWAARNKALAAVERNLAVFNEEGKFAPQALIATKRLVWIELQLGRVPHVLSAITLANGIAAQLKLSEEEQTSYAEELWHQELVLGIHFLNLPFEVLSCVERLPDTLERLGLFSARMALLFALGHEQLLRDEGFIPAIEDSNAVQTHFEALQDQPVAKSIPLQPVLIDGATCLLKSNILGSELVVKTPNNAISISIAESLLGALEALLATSDERDVLPYRECLTIVLSPSEQSTDAPTLRFPDNDDSGRAEIVHPANLRFTTADERRAYMNWLKDSLVQIVVRMLLIRDAHTWIEKMAIQECGFSRAITLGDTLTLNYNVFGETPPVRLIDWLDAVNESYAVLRDRPWRTVKPADPGNPMESPEFGAKSPPDNLNHKERLKHTDRRVLSPIDIPVWDRANWRATVFVPRLDGPPILGIAFQDGEAGRAIFRAWKARWGDVDEADALRVSIITGLSKRKPAEYAIVVGPNLRNVTEDEEKRVSYVAKTNRMSPETTTNVDNFVAAYEKAGVFLLAPAHMNPNPQLLPPEFAIAMRQLDIRQAWQIGENDFDIVALDDEDDPIVPPGVTDPPINKALIQRRAFRAK